MDRHAKEIQARLVNGIPGFSICFDDDTAIHYTFHTLALAQKFYAAFGSLIREVQYTHSHAPSDGTHVNEMVSLCIQPPKED